ncbi:MAG TPA: hypothetical protein VN112_16370 [Ensifer sp.]|nr:hypothetical protein [Ensifer sp.]
MNVATNITNGQALPSSSSIAVATSRNLEAIDRLNRSRALTEAAYMAAGSLDDRNQVNALQHLLQIVSEELEFVSDMLETKEVE